ncbi:MAG: hypothetical protein QOH97_1565 [Actinoplanes sp.]|nr:hypothetical protein [Actinoplanes sp.]
MDATATASIKGATGTVTAEMACDMPGRSVSIRIPAWPSVCMAAKPKTVTNSNSARAARPNCAACRLVTASTLARDHMPPRRIPCIAGKAQAQLAGALSSCAPDPKNALAGFVTPNGPEVRDAETRRKPM